MQQITESRFCILSFNIHAFTKLHSLSLFPKAWTKWKKLLAVSLKPSRLNRILQRVIFFVSSSHFSVPNNTFFMTILSSCMMKCLKRSSLRESNKKIFVFGSISTILHQCLSPFSLLSVLAITKGYLPFFSVINAAWLIKLFIWLEGKAPTKLWFKSLSPLLFVAFSNWKLLITLLILCY